MKFVGKSQSRAPPKRDVDLNWRSGIFGDFAMKFLEITAKTKGKFEGGVFCKLPIYENFWL
jgi:hypothetical protein